MEIMGYNQNHLAAQELFTNQRIEMLKPIRVSEIKVAIKEMYDRNSKMFRIRR
ncbi:hypothetical protein AKJ16_DCAP14104 [Drosera capensis]